MKLSIKMMMTWFTFVSSASFLIVQKIIDKRIVDQHFERPIA